MSHSLEDCSKMKVTDGVDKITAEDLLFKPFGLALEQLHNNRVG